MNKNLRVSVVIPVYNEEEQLAACLRSLASQRVLPYEVIVVDNNSTDGSAAIAESFPFVRLISETTQGVVYARNTGFDSAKGEIIGRIDADTILPSDWIAQLQTIFAEKDVAAVSGSLSYYDIAANGVVDAVDFVMRQWMARRMKNAVFLLGSNMALRSSAWRAVRKATCSQVNMHEDLDLAVHMAERGLKVRYAAALAASVSARRIDVNIAELTRYMLLSPQTYARHEVADRIYMYPLIAIVFVHYLHLRLLFRGYDTRAQRFSWLTLFSSQTVGRVNPGTYS